jgi:hypothetical protein
MLFWTGDTTVLFKGSEQPQSRKPKEIAAEIAFPIMPTDTPMVPTKGERQIFDKDP